MAQKNRDYWEERQIKREAKAFTTIQDIEKEYKIALEKAKQDINKEISKITTTYMNDNILNYNEALKLLKGDDYKVWKKDLHDYIKEYKNLLKTAPLDTQKLYLEIETLSAKSRISRLDSLKAQIDMEFTKLIFGVEDSGKNALNSVYRDTFIEVTKDLGINPIVSRDKIKTVLDKPWSGANFSERLWTNTDKLAQTVKQEIVNGMIQGINLKTMTKRVSERFETAKKNDVERLLRTEVNYVLNQATLDGYKEAGIEKYEFSATLDSRTSQICSELHGEVFEIKKIAVGLNYPPMHPRCRSTTIPIIDYESLVKQGGEEIGEKNDIENNGKEALTNNENKSINEFKEASSIKEANEFAEKILGLKADYDGIDLRCANEWNKGLYEIKNKFPEVVENIKFIGSTQIRNKLILQEIENDLRKAGFSKEAITDSLEYAKREYKIIVNKNAMAVSLFIDKDNEDPVNIIRAKYQGITMNSLHFKNYDEVTESLKMQVNGKWHPVGCDTVKAVFDHEFGHQLDSFLGIRNKKEMIEILEENKKENGKFLSEYSIFNKLDEINIKETIAEGWSEYCNNPNPRELSQKVGKLIEREYNIYKKGSE
ncbi:minor capsid protein [Fusobacterium polymorphum]|uniref:minor capsid protein n=1 Tax=Fusobacterium nucleatum subsp. polymorphum TaxID=76857 RepID=UPI0030CD4F88